MMRDKLTALSTLEIPALVDDLKRLMGICITTGNPNHPLFDYFMEYERWPKLIRSNVPTPAMVIELALFALSVDIFKDDWFEDTVRAYVRRRLNEPREVMGLLFEFRVGVHFLHQHKRVQWMPNMGSSSEFDLRVTTGSGTIVSVECTRKQESSSRLDDPKELCHDIVRALRDKRKQIAGRTDADSVASLVAVLIPEQVDLERWRQIRRRFLHSRIEKLFDKDEFRIISGFAVVGNAPPTTTMLDSGKIAHDTDLLVLPFTNTNSHRPFPLDFSCALV